MIQNKQKLFLYTITNAFVRDWIMIEKTPLHPPIQDDLGGRGGLDTGEAELLVYQR